MDNPPMTTRKEPGRYAYEGLDRVIHEKARLSIVSSLAGQADGLLFNELKEVCALTDGNLSRHISILQDDYWFRYSDLGHNRLNLQLTLGSTAQLGQSVALYSRFSTDYANGLGNSPAYSGVGSGTKTVTTSGGSYTTPFSSSSYGWGDYGQDQNTETNSHPPPKGIH